ncbi:MAG: hypothetical protein QMD20_05260, partial [Candidatus Bathyarchaeia archaeon]|nr:hypothetical protein [Candidatus Bathyarchaeia archaeon]
HWFSFTLSWNYDKRSLHKGKRMVYERNTQGAFGGRKKTKNPKEIKFRTRVKNKEKESLAISP